MKYFQDCEDLHQAKELFTELAKKYHPDTGNEQSSEKFQEVSQEYSEFRTYYKIAVQTGKFKTQCPTPLRKKIAIDPKQLDSVIDSISETGSTILKVGLKVLAERFVK